MTLWCATGNRGKLREFHHAAGDLDLRILPDYDRIPSVEESGETFEANAILKALHYGPFARGLLFADDSGLEVDALGGAPGVRSARFAGPGATDDANNRLLLDKLGRARDRTARFVCVIALADESRLLGTFRGVIEGSIVEQPRGTNGFGYDSVFYCPSLDYTFGEVSPEKKLTVSHRGQAFRRMLAYLRAS